MLGGKGKGMEGIRLADHTDMVQEQLNGPLLMITAGAADKLLLAEAVVAASRLACMD